ncbi:MAG: response regulator [Bdellovibrio sp.]
MPIEVIFIDDEFLLCECFEEDFSSVEIKVKTFNDPQEALHYINSPNAAPDLVFTDYRMPKLNGDELANSINKNVPIYLVSGELSAQPRFAFTKIILKPFHHQEIRTVIFEYLDNIKNNGF